MKDARFGLLVGIVMLLVNQNQYAALVQGQDWQIGFAKTEITPAQPVRLSGYASREQSHEGVADSLHARAMVLAKSLPDGTQADRSNTVVLVSVDSILVTSRLTVEISQWLSEKYHVDRSQLAICSTHSHAAPHIDGGLGNLYRTPSTESQQQATRAYTDQFKSAIRAVIEEAMANCRPGKIEMGESQAGFSVNRRLLKDGLWTGFGVEPDGAVDRRVRVMLATSPTGKVMGGAYMYACHCTTLGGDFNQVSGDWAGLSASRLESIHPDAIFLPVIGCGADANPNPRGSYEFAQQHAAAMVDSVNAVVAAEGRLALADFPVTRFGYAGLAPEQPTDEHLQSLAESERSNERFWSESMRQVKNDMGRLPETYPMPIHTWQFGDDLTWVFLGGEVVVDYQLQIEKELTTGATWVAAYTDDVFAYVASEAMRPQGGYEVDFSMIYYLQPGRWQSGTQSLITRRVKEIAANQLTETGPLTPEEGLASIRVPEDFQVELIASEPLIRDPINIAFDLDGSVWVVEMADYPLGVDGGGRVKHLLDTDGDGKLDSSTTFLSGLDYPSSVMPWQDGVLVISAPDVLFAADRDGDGEAEVRQTLLTGIHAANPQHRASGFEVGLNGWLHFGAGDQTHELTSLKNGQVYNVEGCDVSWNPISGEIRTVSGETQFVRARDAYGNWFGNSNSRPIYQYVIEDCYRNGGFVTGGVRKDLLDPPIAPPVYPYSKTIDRFNDLFAFNRFTSACSSIVGRVPGLGPNYESVGLICEPVHNLVARIELNRSGSTLSARRHPADDSYDFFASSDPWSRPVRAVNSPDGTIWIVDMMRKVIEHPQWIPTAWQDRIDLRGGSQQGRIYRVYHKSFSPKPLPVLSNSKSQWLAAISSENGALRDLALLRIIGSEGPDLAQELSQIARESSQPSVRVSALGCLAAKGWLSVSDLVSALRDTDPRVVRYALELSEGVDPSDDLRDAINEVVGRNSDPQVDLQWVLTSTRIKELDATVPLGTIAARSRDDLWISRALSLVSQPEQAFAIAVGMIDSWSAESSISPNDFYAAVEIIGKLWERSPKKLKDAFQAERIEQIAGEETSRFSNKDLLFLAILAGHAEGETHSGRLQVVFTRALQRIEDSDAPVLERSALINLMGFGLMAKESELRTARQLLQHESRPEIKQAAIEAVRRIDSPEVSDMLLGAWGQMSIAQKTSACASLLTKRQWVESLIVALERGDIQPNELDPASVQQLRSYRDRSLRTRCLAVFGKPTPRTEVVTQYLAQTPSPVETEASQQLYKEHCAVCHQAQPGKAMIGPPLENLKHWTIDQWVTAIMDPNRNVEPKYQQSTFLTDDDQVVTGLVQESTGDSIRIAQADGSVRELKRSEIVESKPSIQSLMPEGFEQKLSPSGLSALLGYLRNQ